MSFSLALLYRVANLYTLNKSSSTVTDTCKLLKLGLFICADSIILHLSLLDNILTPSGYFYYNLQGHIRGKNGICCKPSSNTWEFLKWAPFNASSQGSKRSHMECRHRPSCMSFFVCVKKWMKCGWSLQDSEHWRKVDELWDESKK